MRQCGVQLVPFAISSKPSFVKRGRSYTQSLGWGAACLDHRVRPVHLVAGTPISTPRLTLACLFCDTLATAHSEGNSNQGPPEELLEFLGIPPFEYQPTRRIISTEDGSNHTSPARRTSTIPSTEAQVPTAASPAVRTTRLGGASSHRKFLTLCNDHNQHSCHVHRTGHFRRLLQSTFRVRESIGPGETPSQQSNIACRTTLTGDTQIQWKRGRFHCTIPRKLSPVCFTSATLIISSQTDGK